MTLSAVALASRALLRIGTRAINSFDDGTVESDLAGALYMPLRDGLLSSFGWSFATTQKELVRLASPPLADYDYAFQLPNDFLRAISAGVIGTGRGIRYRLYQNALHCNLDAVTLTYIYRPAEIDCPAFFDTALIARLAAELCIPITESTSRAELLFSLADKELQRARQIDSQQETPSSIEDFSLLEARRS
jgi:hypothetical protein